MEMVWTLSTPIKRSSVSFSIHLSANSTQQCLNCSSSSSSCPPPSQPLVLPSCSCVRRTSWASESFPLSWRPPPSSVSRCPCRVCHAGWQSLAGIGGAANATDGSEEGSPRLCQGENGSAANEYFQKPLLPCFIIMSRFFLGDKREAGFQKRTDPVWEERFSSRKNYGALSEFNSSASSRQERILCIQIPISQL